MKRKVDYYHRRRPRSSIYWMIIGPVTVLLFSIGLIIMKMYIIMMGISPLTTIGTVEIACYFIASGFSVLAIQHAFKIKQVSGMIDEFRKFLFNLIYEKEKEDQKKNGDQ